MFSNSLPTNINSYACLFNRDQPFETPSLQSTLSFLSNDTASIASEEVCHEFQMIQHDDLFSSINTETFFDNQQTHEAHYPNLVVE